MADIKTKEERSRNMAAIKGKDTKPEMIVRKYLFSRGLRFRIQVKKLPGNPDIVLPKYKAVIFVNGCFWHRHEGCKYFRLPQSNVEFWKDKIERNVLRDMRNEGELKAMGWHVFRIWECEIKTNVKRRDKLEQLYYSIINLLSNFPSISQTEDPGLIVAEPISRYGGKFVKAKSQ